MPDFNLQEIFNEHRTDSKDNQVDSMSVNDTGADCTCCGSYNCSYLCLSCVLTMLLFAGVEEAKAIDLLKEHGIELDQIEIEEARRNINAK